MPTLTVRVFGRPAPEGSHEIGANGYVKHSSIYLAGWRAAVNRATREAYVAAGLTGADMPFVPYPRPVSLIVWHVVLDEQCRAEGTSEPTGSPDDDKLLRATIDGLGEARAFGNDSQVTQHLGGKRRPAPGEEPGAYITISDEPLITRLLTIPTATREIDTMQGFKASGEYRLVLERVGTDGDGDKSWETVVEVTDTPEAIAATWLPSLGIRLAGEQYGAAPAATSAGEAPAESKSAPKRPRKATVAAAETPAAAPEPAPASVEAPPAAPVPQTVAEAAAAPAAVRVNPFAK